ncbi:hypothetical protein HMPREF7215_1904 [Pyramidobacter piscolens W5455]|uniref:Uncharacterized protein n=1 Tax=Pyramidobacter piscolens W5455 TaxID=352165 RepID=A0ABM9ZX98_9BACT|nr:hypothetical protein HMPREF7215_1904 [Pyramidobacter piscolens W5455]
MSSGPENYLNIPPHNLGNYSFYKTGRLHLELSSSISSSKRVTAFINYPRTILA